MMKAQDGRHAKLSEETGSPVKLPEYTYNNWRQICNLKAVASQVAIIKCPATMQTESTMGILLF